MKKIQAELESLEEKRNSTNNPSRINNSIISSDQLWLCVPGVLRQNQQSFERILPNHLFLLNASHVTRQELSVSPSRKTWHSLLRLLYQVVLQWQRKYTLGVIYLTSSFNRQAAHPPEFCGQALVCHQSSEEFYLKNVRYWFLTVSHFGMSGKQTSDQSKGNTILTLKKQNKQMKNCQ